LALAIIDDVGSIVVIAVFYADHIDVLALVGAVVALGVVVVLRRAGIASPGVYVVPAIALWLLLHESGVHATIAGVALGLLTPARPIRGRAVLVELEHRLHPIAALVVVPLFALANAGVTVRADSVRAAAGSAIAWGVVLGLVVGKTVGITAGALLARRLGVGRLPPGVGARHLIGGAALGGIGFTVSLFVADLSFGGTPHLAEVKLAILAASVIAAIVGTLVLRSCRTTSGP
jgi:NhaA family Na+:H+ antiporter